MDDNIPLTLNYKPIAPLYEWGDRAICVEAVELPWDDDLIPGQTEWVPYLKFNCIWRCNPQSQNNF